MLRRKLIFNLGPPVIMLVLTAVVAVWLLEGYLHRLDHFSAHASGAARVEDLAAEAHQLEQLTWEFRRFVFGLAVVFLLVINVSIILLLHVGGQILRPVAALVHASRQLAEERFDHRVRLDQHDEFDELAGAFNSMAERLAANERRRIEVLGQVALALNHELNNAIAIVDMQISLLARQSPGGAQMEKRMRQIHEGLSRMTATVQGLKNVRRIVLTDYVPGMKMLDLRRSTEDEEAPAAAATVPANPDAPKPAVEVEKPALRAIVLAPAARSAGRTAGSQAESRDPAVAAAPSGPSTS